MSQCSGGFLLPCHHLPPHHRVSLQELQARGGRRQEHVPAGQRLTQGPGRPSQVLVNRAGEGRVREEQCEMRAEWCEMRSVMEEL